MTSCAARCIYFVSPAALRFKTDGPAAAPVRVCVEAFHRRTLPQRDREKEREQMQRRLLFFAGLAGQLFASDAGEARASASMDGLNLFHAVR
jgi:hypothetical protein